MQNAMHRGFILGLAVPLCAPLATGLVHYCHLGVKITTRKSGLNRSEFSITVGRAASILRGRLFTIFSRAIRNKQNKVDLARNVFIQKSKFKKYYCNGDILLIAILEQLLPSLLLCFRMKMYCKKLLIYRKTRNFNCRTEQTAPKKVQSVAGFRSKISKWNI